MDGSATIVKQGHAPYGTDDVSDDVTQDAVLLFAQRLRDISASCRKAPESTAEASMWVYVRRDGGEMTISRTTLHRWSVRDAAARNGYRVDVPPTEVDATSGAQLMRAVPRAENVTRAAVAFCAAQNSAVIFRQAFGDGRDFPVLRDVMQIAAQADDLGRAGILSKVAQKRYGGAYGSRRAVIRARDVARAEWKDLSERIDDARDTLTYGDESTKE
jgi:galactarate dehydratase